VIAQVSGRLAAKQADRVIVHTAGGVGYEVIVPLGVMEHLPAIGEPVTLATELVVRDDAWALYGFARDAERRFFQLITGVAGVGPRTAIALMSALGVERAVRALRERDIAALASVSGIGRKTAERLALELADKLGELESVLGTATPARGEGGGAAEAALKALERLGYGTAEADRALRQALAGDGAGADTEGLIRRTLQLLANG
jgi:holliday junction DNA helicase RuvA